MIKKTMWFLLAFAMTIPVLAGPEVKKDIDPEAMKSGERGVLYLIRREAGNRTARYVRITPGSHGGMFGQALHLFVDNKLVYAKFMPFADAIDMGNAHVAGDLKTNESKDKVIAAKESERESYELNNIKMYVAKNPKIGGYHVDVCVDNFFVTPIYKDCNHCAIFDYPQAVRRAKEYLVILQGWRR